MTRLASLHARITGDSSGFVTAATTAKTAADKTSLAIGGTGGGGVAGGGLAGSVGKASGAFKSFGSSNSLRMLPMQLSQVAQQAAAGTTYMRALTIQAADIGMAFGVVGTIIGTLATIALPTIISAFSDTEEEGDDAAEALERFASALGRATSAAEIAKTPIQDLRAEYGAFAVAVQETSRIVAQAELANAMREFGEAAAMIEQPLNDVDRALNKYTEAVKNLQTFQRTQGEETISNASAFDQFTSAVDEARSAVVDAAAELGLSASEAVKLRISLDELSSASGPEEVAEVASTILALFEDIFTTSENIPPALGALISTLRTIQMEAAAAATAVAPLTGGDGGGGSAAPEAPGTRPQMRPMDLGDPEPKRRGGGGGGRSAAHREDEKFQKDLERLQDQLATEIELEREMNEERNQMLAEALTKELLTQQEYDELIERERKRHNDEMESLDVYSYGSRAAQMGQFMGDMASAFASGNEKMLQISKVFGAGEALINAWRTFSQVMSDPSLPWYAKLPAAVSLLGSAMQAVSAINSVGKGGTGSKSASGGGAGAGGAGTGEPSVAPRPNVSLTLIGESGFTRAQIVQVAEALNDSGDEGQRLVQIRGRQ